MHCTCIEPRPEDLRIGVTVNVHGRSFLLYDCDAATRAWYTVRHVSACV